MTEPLPGDAVIGILGGGQLGRMLSVAAARLGYRCHVYDPAPEPPAGDVARWVTTAGWDDQAALAAFGRACDVVTFEFENVPVACLDALGTGRPGRRALEVSQDRLAEKTFLRNLGLATAPFADVTYPELDATVARMGPGILKTRRFGYDGKGQARLRPGDDTDAAADLVGGAPAIYEALVPFEREVSVVIARALDGTSAAFDPAENRHEGGILRSSRVPAALGPGEDGEARAIARTIADALDYIGVLGVELFATPSGLVVNEIAPRVHNSGHWTLDACAVDQFEQHVRAITGWPLGDPARHSDATMTNLIGADVEDVPAWARRPACAIHLYGKRETRPGRKMGHVTELRPRGTPGA